MCEEGYHESWPRTRFDADCDDDCHSSFIAAALQFIHAIMTRNTDDDCNTDTTCCGSIPTSDRECIHQNPQVS